MQDGLGWRSARLCRNPDRGAHVELYACWQRGELTPEDLAEQNDFFRAWIEKVVVSPARRRGRARKDAPPDVPDRVRIVWR